MARSTDRIGVILDYRARGLKSIDKLAGSLSRVDKRFRGLRKNWGKTPFRPATISAKEFQGAMANMQSTMRAGQGTMRQSQNALHNFSMVLQDAPFGIRGVANNIPMLLNSMQQLKQRTGSTGGAFKALLSQMKGPGGFMIIGAALLPLVGEISRKVDIFGGKSEKAAKSAKKLLERWDQMLENLKEAADLDEQTPFDFQAQQVALEKTQQLINELQSKINDKYLDWGEALEGANNIFTAITFKIASWLGESERVKAVQADINKLKQKEMELQGDILSAKILSEQTTAQNIQRITEIINKTQRAREVSKTLAEARQENLKSLKEQAREASKVMDADVALPDFQTAAEVAKEHQKQAAKNAEKIQEKTLQNRIKIARLQGQKLKALRLQRQKELEETRKFDLTNWEEAKNLRFQIKKKYDKKIAQAEKDLAKDKAKSQQWFLQKKIQLAELANDRQKALYLKEKLAKQQLDRDKFQSEKQYQKAITLLAKQFSGRREDIAEQETVTRREKIQMISDFATASVEAAFGETKAARHAIAGINTLTGITQALASGSPPWSFIQAAAVAAKGFAAQRRISQMSLEGGSTGSGGIGTGGGGQRFGFRGFSSQSGAGMGQNDINFPNELRLTDRAGNFLTKLEYARDQQGDDPYLVEKEPERQR